MDDEPRKSLDTRRQLAAEWAARQISTRLTARERLELRLIPVPSSRSVRTASTLT